MDRGAAKRRDHSRQLDQHLEAQRPLSRLRALIGRILRQRQAAKHATVAHVQPTSTLAAHSQHLQPPPEQRMERMRDNQRI
jgi:hypothetical protein